MDAVSEVLAARAARADGLSSMLGASAMAHIVLVGLFVFLPAAWFGAQFEQPETIMQISLGGPIGPSDGGLATQGGRTIQELQKVEMKKAIEPVRPPSAKAPEMIEPTKAPPKKTTPNKVEAKDPKSNRPTKGEEIQKGSSIAENKAKGQGFGLSSGGGGGHTACARVRPGYGDGAGFAACPTICRHSRTQAGQLRRRRGAIPGDPRS